MHSFWYCLRSSDTSHFQSHRSRLEKIRIWQRHWEIEDSQGVIAKGRKEGRLVKAGKVGDG